MRSWRHAIIQLYVRLLRLYPPHFRAEYADEMAEVFALAVGEAEDGLALLGIVGAELRDLPWSLFREHQRERRALLPVGEAVIINNHPNRIFRFCTVGMLFAFALYALVAVLPFFLLGIHLQPPDRVASGFFDPTNLPLYGAYGENFGRGHGNPLWFATIIILLITPLLQLGFGARLLTLIIRSRHVLKPAYRSIGITVVFLSVALIIFAASPLGLLIMGWWID